MSLTIQDECEYFFGCFRTIIFSVICLVIVGFTIYGMKQIHKQLNKWSFEIIPLATTLVQALVQFVMIFFYNGLDLMVTGLYVQNTTFLIVCMSFVMLYYRTKYNSDGSYKKIIFYTFLTVNLVLILALILTYVNVFNLSCSDFFQVGYIIPMAALFIITTITIIYGQKLRNQVKQFSQSQQGDYEQLEDKEEKTSNINTNQSKITTGSGQRRSASGPNIKNYISLNNQDSAYYNNQSKLILSILITFAFTGVAQLLLDILRENGIKDQAFTCDVTSDHKMFDPNGNNIGAQIYMVLYQLVIIIPCTYVPYAFYYVPFGQKNRNKFRQAENEYKDFNIDQDDNQESDYKNKGESNNTDNLINGNFFKDAQNSQDNETKATVDYCNYMDNEIQIQEKSKITVNENDSLYGTDQNQESVQNNQYKDTFALAQQYSDLDYMQNIDYNQSKIK